MRSNIPRNELIAHPIRLRIINAIAERSPTTEEVRQTMDDIARATFYRHLGLLIDAGMVQVDEEAYRPGGRDRRLRLAPDAGMLDRSTIDPHDPEQNQTLVDVFLGTLSAGFAQYLRSPQSEGQADRWLCRGRIVYLDEEQLKYAQAKLLELLQGLTSQPAKPGARRYRVAVATLPDRELDSNPNP